MPGAAFTYDPFSVEAMTEPLAQYSVLRKLPGPYRLDRYHAWALSRFADVWEVFTDLENFSIVEGPIFDVRVIAELSLSYRASRSTPGSWPILRRQKGLNRVPVTRC